MGWWRDHLLLPALAVAALAPLSSAREMTITSAFTTVVPTTAVVTSSSEVAGCTVASSMQLACGNGYYNTWGAVWQETCSASYSGGSIMLSSPGLSLRACASACAVRSTCSGVVWNGATCFLLQGDVTITPGGPYQAALRYSPSASPCVSTWLVTETDSFTSTGEVVYTITQTPTSTSSSVVIVTPSSTPVQSPSSPSISPSSTRVSSSSSLVPPSSALVSSSSKPSSTPFIRSSTSTSSGTSSPASSPVRLSSTPLIRTSMPSSVTIVSTSVIPSGSSSVSASSSPSTSPSSAASSVSSDGSASASSPNVSATQLGTSSTALAFTTVMPIETSPSTQSSGETSVTTSSASTYTVTATEVHTLTSCAAAVTNCPAHQQTTYLTTQTITYVTTVCPASAQTTAAQATGPVENAPSVTQTGGASSPQSSETGVPHSQLTTSTVYVTEIDVVTACPPSVLNCPAREKSTHTTTKTVATYTTTYLVAATETAEVPQSENASANPVAVPTLPLVQPHLPGHGLTENHTIPHAVSSSTWKTEVVSSGSARAAAHATTMNTVSGQSTSSVTTSATGSLFTGDASKMVPFSSLFTVVALLSVLFFF